MSSATAFSQNDTSLQESPASQDALKLMDALSVKENDKVLDIGCGIGQYTSVIADRVGPGGKVVGVDPDKERIEIANEKYARSNLEFLEGDSENFPEDQYDVVFSNYVFHRIKEKEAMFKIVGQNMRPGGKFGFTHPACHIPIFSDLSYLMGPVKGEEILQSMGWYETTERYLVLGSSNGLVPVQNETYHRTFGVPNLDVFFKVWYGVTHGAFDPTAVDEADLEKFKQQYGTGPFKVTMNMISMIFSKPLLK